jgi:hypothetical protein
VIGAAVFSRYRLRRAGRVAWISQRGFVVTLTAGLCALLWAALRAACSAVGAAAVSSGALRAGAWAPAVADCP